MPFLSSARARVAALSNDEPERIILEFLLRNAVGRFNAKPWSVLEAHLRSRGMGMSQQAFQQGILKKTRESDIFIGSNDHGASKGYFLIQDQADAEVMRDWYVNRVSVEQSRLDNLRAQARAAGWRI